MTRELTARQEAFSQSYAKYRSLRRAYRDAYDCPEDLPAKTLDKRAREVLDAPAVRKRIEELIQEASRATVFTITEALERCLMAATADPNEIVALKVGCCRYCHGDGHRYQWTLNEYTTAVEAVEKRNAAPGRKGPPEALPDVAGGFDFNAASPPHPQCPECHGEGVARPVVRDTEELSPGARLLYNGVKVTTAGIQIILGDRKEWFDMACKLAGFLKDDVRVSGRIGHYVQAVEDMAKVDDPNEAARIYADMVSGRAKPN